METWNNCLKWKKERRKKYRKCGTNKTWRNTVNQLYLLIITNYNNNINIVIYYNNNKERKKRLDREEHEDFGLNWVLIEYIL